MDNFLYLPRSFAALLFDIAFAGAFGSLFASFWLRQSVLLQSARRTLTLSSVVMLAMLPAQLWLLTATMIGLSSPADIRPQLYDVLTGTHAGRVLIPDVVCVVVLLLLSLARSRTASYLALATIFFLAAFRAAGGHAAASLTSEIVQYLHLTSIAIWAGCIMTAGFLILPRLHELEAATLFGRRLSFSATIAIVVVALSGIYNAWIGLGGSLAPLPHTQWGILLLTKSALVLTALALGANNRLILRRNPTLLAADARSFTRSMRLEAVAMLAILILSGFLANSPPATGM